MGLTPRDVDIRVCCPDFNDSLLSQALSDTIYTHRVFVCKSFLSCRAVKIYQTLCETTLSQANNKDLRTVFCESRLSPGKVYGCCNAIRDREPFDSSGDGLTEDVRCPKDRTL